ncbi:MAG: hypothetical protein WCJ25_05175 [Candidatus Moraniibacteriota bacterium]
MTDEIKSEPIEVAPKAEAPKTEEKKTDTKNALAQLESMLDEYLVKKAPFTIPEDGKELIVKISPYITLIFAVMGLPLIFGAIGLTALLAPMAFLGAHYGVTAFLSAIFAAISLILELIAVPGLFARSKKGWTFAFYATIVSVLGNIVSFDIVGGVIGAVIGWYILFQVKEKYVN